MWHTGQVVRINEDETYTIKYDESKEFWMECPKEKVRRDLRMRSAVKEAVDEGEDDSKKMPNTWQYRCLLWQESIPVTFLICIIVFLELFLVNDIESDSDRMAWGLAITCFFAAEIILRMYNYFHTFDNMVRPNISV